GGRSVAARRERHHIDRGRRRIETARPVRARYRSHRALPVRKHTMRLALRVSVATMSLLEVQLTAADSVAALSWTSDAKGDGLQARLPDAKELFFAIDSRSDRVWFKVITWEPVPEDWFGISVAFDSDDKPDN